MKKFLSLVLALVMTMSLVTVSAGAKDFNDAGDVQHTEAVEVLSAIGVINGMPDGSFNPKGSLTRAQAAKIITSITLTPETAAELTTDTAPFADVAASHWAAGYIAEGVDAGILAGTGAGKFSPDAELKGFEFAKMLLVALGYDATAEGMTGSTWSIAVAKLAKKVGLTAGISGFVGNKVITREEAAQMALNALKKEKVGYDETAGSTSITIGDLVIATNPGKAEGTGDDLYENFKTLKLTKSGTDALGRPATKWTYEKEEIGTYAGTADYTVTLTKAVKDLEKYLDDEDIAEVEYTSKTEYYVNGDEAELNAGLQAGSIVEIFTKENDEGDEEITDVAVINYTLGKIKTISTKLTKAQKEDGAEAKITIDGEKTVLDIDFAGFDYEEGDYILYVQVGTKVLASELAESVEGKVDGKKSNGDVRIDGEYYDALIEIAAKSEGTFYLNAAGQIVKFVGDEGSISEDYAYVYNTGKVSADENEDGVDGAEAVKAYVVLTDGTKTSYIVEEDSTVEKGKVYAYSINDDGEFVVEKFNKDIDVDYVAAKDVKIDKKNAEVDGIDVLSSTEFIFAEWNKKGTKLTVETATGYKAVSVVNEDIVVISEDGEALFVFVEAGNGNLTSDKEYAVLLSADYEIDWDDDDKALYTYSVAVDGEEIELTLKEAQIKLPAGTIFTYEMDGNYATEITAVEGKVKVTAANDDYFRAGARYEYGEEELYTITLDFEDEAAYEKNDVDSVDVAEGGEIEKGDEVVLVKNADGDLEIIFVFEYIY